MARNIYDNPSGKPYCCLDDCEEDAVWHVEKEGGHPYEDHTHSCDKHLADAIRFVADGGDARVFPLETANQGVKS